LQKGEIRESEAKEGTSLPMNRHFWITKEVLQLKTNGEKITDEMVFKFNFLLRFIFVILSLLDLLWHWNIWFVIFF